MDVMFRATGWVTYMPKVSLESARARDNEILDKLGRMQKAAQGHKQQTKLNQQRHEWIEQARGLNRDARKLEEDLVDSISKMAQQQLVVKEEFQVPGTPGTSGASEVWLQVSGLRQLVHQLRMRDPQRLREAPQQVFQLKEVMHSISVAISDQSQKLSAKAALLEEECLTTKTKLRKSELDGCEKTDLGKEDGCDLSDEENHFLENIFGENTEEDYRKALEELNCQVAASLIELDQELGELRHKRAGWDNDAHFRFLHIKKDFQGRRDLFVERLRLEFPHLNREQLQQHEVTCDALKFASQKQAATFRQWRRDRLNLLRQHQQWLLQGQKAREAQQKRLQEMLEVEEKGKLLRGRLQVERRRALAKREERELEAGEEQRRQLALQVEKQQKQKKRAEVVRQLSHNFAEQRREQQQQEKEDAMQREQQEAEERAIRMERNARMVEMRRQLDELKRKEVAQKRAALEQERLEREMALQRAMEHLKVEVPRDPARLHKVPERLNVDAYNDPLVCVTRGPAAGFDENRLMADARYKLSAALQAAGLYSTKAGQEALSHVAAPKPSQPHLMSQVFAGNFGGYPKA